VEAFTAAVPGGPSPVVVADDALGETLVIPTTHSESDEWEAAFPATGLAAPRSPARAHQPSTARRNGHPKRSKPRSRRRSRIRRAALGVGILIALAGLGAVGWVATWNYMIAPVVQVPAVTAIDMNEASEQLEARGLLLALADQQHTLDAPEGEVIAQRPPPGTELRRGDVVDVVVSAGPPWVEMPSVSRMSLDEARRELEGEPYLFTIQQVDEYHHDDIPRGVVIGQQPDAGTRMRQTSHVVLAISIGIEQVTVPDLSGKTAEEAEAALTDAKLGVEVTREYSDAVPTAGRVITQSREAGEEVDKNTVVTVTISRGSLTISVPRVEGKPIAEAVAELEALDLEVRVIREPRPRVGPFRRGEFGLVEAQNPQPGETLQRGGRVDLYTFAPDEEFDDDDDDDDDD
jgi:eukaryotic-like serine/threonine-protein kinase